MLAASHLNLPRDKSSRKNTAANTPLIFETEDTLSIHAVSHNTPHCNPLVQLTCASNQTYVKTLVAHSGLSEIAAREMAEIVGLEGLIPSNTINKSNVMLLHDHQDGSSMPNAGLVQSREKIEKLIDERRLESPEQNIKNTPGVQNAIAKYVFNLKTAVYRTKAQKKELLELYHIQKLIPNATDGYQVYCLLMNEPVILPGQIVLGGLTSYQKQQQRAQAKSTLEKISLSSFQENFLLHLVLGSKDANPANTLFTNGPNDDVVLHNIDHERIMPEDNYDITKKISLANGADLRRAVKKDVKNVFPIRLWLAGLPQANVPFTKEIIAKTIMSLNPERLLAYHRQKKLFSPAAVGAQLERILFIKKIFEEALKNPQITLTPKALFLKFINNHPTYAFLKNDCKLSDFSTFMLLGQVPEGADLSLLRHPLQWFPMLKMIIEAQIRAKEAQQNRQQDLPLFSEESFKSSHAHHVIFFSMVAHQKMFELSNKAGLDVLTETSKQLKLN